MSKIFAKLCGRLLLAGGVVVHFDDKARVAAVLLKVLLERRRVLSERPGRGRRRGRAGAGGGQHGDAGDDPPGGAAPAGHGDGGAGSENAVAPAPESPDYKLPAVLLAFDRLSKLPRSPTDKLAKTLDIFMPQMGGLGLPKKRPIMDNIAAHLTGGPVRVDKQIGEDPVRYERGFEYKPGVLLPAVLAARRGSIDTSSLRAHSNAFFVALAEAEARVSASEAQDPQLAAWDSLPPAASWLEPLLRARLDGGDAVEDVTHWDVYRAVKKHINRDEAQTQIGPMEFFEDADLLALYGGRTRKPSICPSQPTTLWARIVESRKKAGQNSIHRKLEGKQKDTVDYLQQTVPTNAFPAMGYLDTEAVWGISADYFLEDAEERAATAEDDQERGGPFRRITRFQCRTTKLRLRAFRGPLLTHTLDIFFYDDRQLVSKDPTGRSLIKITIDLRTEEAFESPEEETRAQEKAGEARKRVARLKETGSPKDVPPLNVNNGDVKFAASKYTIYTGVRPIPA
ncbi:unnamed protein product [Amoebophrya sp. A120]|nr:unnamed protein product [Amoebophrya sp. A120]|eukprot:GSA120T00008919001.1